MSGDRTADVARLADMLVRAGIERGQLGRIDADNLARVLMRTVDEIADERARQRAADELEAASDEVGVHANWRRRLTARAAALRGTP